MTPLRGRYKKFVRTAVPPCSEGALPPGQVRSATSPPAVPVFDLPGALALLQAVRWLPVWHSSLVGLALPRLWPPGREPIAPGPIGGAGGEGGEGLAHLIAVTRWGCWGSWSRRARWGRVPVCLPQPVEGQDWMSQLAQTRHQTNCPPPQWDCRFDVALLRRGHIALICGRAGTPKAISINF